MLTVVALPDLFLSFSFPFSFSCSLFPFLFCLAFSLSVFVRPSVFPSCYPSSCYPSSLLPSSLFPFFPSLAFLASFYPSIPCSFLPWYILFPFIWLSLAFSSFSSMFTLLTIIFPYIASYGYSMQYYII